MGPQHLIDTTCRVASRGDIIAGLAEVVHEVDCNLIGRFGRLAVEKRKESRLQGLKDQLAAVDSTDSEDLQREIEELEYRIEELTSFKSGTTFE